MKKKKTIINELGIEEEIEFDDDYMDWVDAPLTVQNVSKRTYIPSLEVAYKRININGRVKYDGINITAYLITLGILQVVTFLGVVYLCIFKQET